MIQAHFGTEKTNVQTQGSTYNEDFGEAYISDFKKLAIINYFYIYIDYTITYVYRITSDNYLQLIDIDQFNNNFKRRIVAQYKYDNNLSFIENLKTIITEFIHSRCMFDGQITQFESDIISDELYHQIQQSIEDKIIDNTKSELLDYMHEVGLDPVVHDSEKGLFISKCVNSANHPIFIVITSEKEEWTCGYCHKKGGLTELKEWIEFKNSKN
ncbi:hypothetical protein OBK14_11535 [Empedobacter falsenii]